MKNRAVSHGRAIAMMALATLLWSSAGVVTRKLEVAGGADMTFLRSFFCALALFLIIGVWRGFTYLPKRLATPWGEGAWVMWASGVCWAMMFTIYMLAFSFTSVANVLITLSLEPLLSALLAWLVLGNRVKSRTWTAIGVAGIGMAWIFASELDKGQWWGTVMALVVPMGAATNWMLMQKGAHAVASVQGNNQGPTPAPYDMLPSIFIGACLSALLTLPFAYPVTASNFDFLLLAGLGFLQLAVPCILAVLAAKRLPAHELAMLAMLEVIFGILWVWALAGEKPSLQVIQGGVLVLTALILNEVLALREDR